MAKHHLLYSNGIFFCVESFVYPISRHTRILDWLSLPLPNIKIPIVVGLYPQFKYPNIKMYEGFLKWGTLKSSASLDPYETYGDLAIPDTPRLRKPL